MTEEVRQRPLWRILGFYVAASWICLQVVDVLGQNIGLPSWVFVLTLTLLLIGLPVTAATAYFQNKRSQISANGASSGQLFTWRNLLKGGVAALAIWGIAVTGWVVQSDRSSAESERNLVESLDEIRRLAGTYHFDEGYAIAEQLDQQITDDSVREAMWSEVARELTIETEPSGATVYRRNYMDASSEWQELGVTPLNVERFPLGLSQLRFELDGYLTRETTGFSSVIAAAERYVLDTPESMPADMVRVSGSTTTIQAPGLEQFEALELPDFFVDRHEVTNEQYKVFVDSGAYGDAECWTEPFVKEGQTLSFADAMRLFVDKTGRPGPSTWEVGSYPDGAGQHPVGGISWYEAAAYACFVGKELPTVYHWYAAADPFSSNFVVPQSNYSGKGTAPVGTYKGTSRDGAYDMAGNVREWTVNQDGEARYILGGGYNDPEYAFNDAITSPAFDRSGSNGVRLVRYPDKANLQAASASIAKSFRDYTQEEAVSDDVYALFEQFYAYDDSPLNASLVERIESATYVREQIEMDAAYGDERLTVFVFTPTGNNFAAPYQAVTYFPGSNDIYKRSFDELQLGSVEFIIRSGRALVYPVYKGTYTRNGGLASDVQSDSNQYRDFVIAWRKDLGRAIDYLSTRDDIDTARLAYLGFSWGGAMSPIMMALEDRFKAAVLYVPGLMMQEVQPVADPFNFLPRVKIPVFMFNGRYDSFFPLETSIKPFFDNLGTPEADKKLTVTDANHFVAAYNGNQLIQESLEWLDKYLGPVKQAN